METINATTYHLYITLTKESINDYRKLLKNRKELKKVEIAVEYNNEIKEFTYEEFIKLLGFNITGEK